MLIFKNVNTSRKIIIINKILTRIFAKSIDGEWDKISSISCSFVAWSIASWGTTSVKLLNFMRFIQTRGVNKSNNEFAPITQVVFYDLP